MVEVFGIAFYVYGIVIGLAVVAGFWVAERVARKLRTRNSKLEITSEDVWNGLWWVVVPAIVGARIYHVFGVWDYYREHLWEVLAIWNGGLGVFGGMVGGVFGVWSYCYFSCCRERGYTFRLLSKVWLGRLRYILRKPGLQPGRSSLHEKIPPLFHGCVLLKFLLSADLAAFGLPVGQAIGRWGNFINGELYGGPTDLPWGLFVDLERRAKSFEQFNRFHPLFLYESLWSLFTFGVLFLVFRAKGGRLRGGSYFALYLVFYGFGRFWLEFLRIELWSVGGLNVAQFVSLLMVFLGGLYLSSSIIEQNRSK